jgi:prevent-host-death family protein
MTEIGAFEPKTQFSRLLDRAKNGEAFTITHRGVPIARLGPVSQGPDVAKVREALARLRRHARDHGGAPISTDDILEWKAAGQR